MGMKSSLGLPLIMSKIVRRNRVTEFFITGVSGSIGFELYKRVMLLGNVTGCARQKPDWWNKKDRFVSLDFLSGDISKCYKYINNKTIIIHLLNLAHEDTNTDLKNTLDLYVQANKKNAKKFVYISSIRVYGGNFGDVDEQTIPIPHQNDIYGNAKLAAENALRSQCEYAKVPLAICRIGSVFSVKTKNKIPIELRKISRIIDKGINTHLISASNAAGAIEFVANREETDSLDLYNVTQELDGENDFMKLGDLLRGNPRPDAHYKSHITMRWLRNLYKRYKKVSHSMPYVNVFENKLNERNYSYENNLQTSLFECVCKIG